MAKMHISCDYADWQASDDAAAWARTIPIAQIEACFVVMSETPTALCVHRGWIINKLTLSRRNHGQDADNSATVQASQAAGNAAAWPLISVA